jgi:predicted ATP-grasp superfamily ATP-dependent carboligase
MQKYNPIIIKSKKAIRLANYLSAKYKIENLRPSTNDSSIEGFKSIAFEIFENLGDIDAIFTFVTSGSSFVGIGRAYQYLLENKEIKKMPKLYAVQGGNIKSIAKEFNNAGDTSTCRLQAGKFGIKNTRRKKEILELIKLSGGEGIYINDSEIQKAKNILEKNKIYTSLEGCASFAGIIKTSEKSKFNKVVCILSGKLRKETNKIDEKRIFIAESFEDIDVIARESQRPKSCLRQIRRRRTIPNLFGPIFFITPNPNRAIGLEKIIKNYYVVCSQKSDTVSHFEEEKISVLCLNDSKIKNSGKILANKKTIEYIKEKSGNKKASIITFKPSPMIQKICEENNFKYLGNDWKLNRKLEDKIEFVKITKKLKIPNAESEAIKAEEGSFSKYIFKLKNKNKFVVQLPRGFSGNSTFLIKSKKDLDKILKKYKNRKVKFSKYLEGETWTMNACVGKTGLAISQPIFQITGLTAYNRNKLGTCGNDYAYGEKFQPEGADTEKIFNYTRKIGDYLGSLGYKGIFGLDFIVSNGEVNLIEINPRLVASIPVFTKLQIQNNEEPFLLSHILEFVDLTPLSPPLSGGKIFNVSQLILRNTKNKPIKIMKNLKPGIYEIKKDKLIFKEEAYYVNRNLNKSEFLIQCVAKNSIINPDMEYANIQTNYGIMKNGKKFKSYFDNIVCIVV